MLKFDALSFWEKESYLNKVDYLIIGSGIVGLSTAIHLKQKHKNKKVLILERGYLPSGASTKNAGFACIGSPSELLDDLKNNSETSVFETVQKRWEGLNYLRSLLGEKNIDYKQLGAHEIYESNQQELYQNCLDSLSYLNEKLKEITGIASVYQQNDRICKNSGFKSFQYAISNLVEGQLDTGLLMQSLIAQANKLGVLLLNGIEVKAIEPKRVLTAYGNISFRKLALCNNALAKDFLPEEDINPSRGQIIITAPIKDLKIKGIYHFDLGYYYFRNVGERLLLGGGRNLNFDSEKTTELKTTEALTNHLKAILRDKILSDTTYQIEHQWAGIMGLGKSKGPIIKKIDEAIYCGVRLGGMGVAIGSLVGKDLAELIDQ